MDSDDATPDDVTPTGGHPGNNEMAEKVAMMETRVREMEQALIVCATRLHNSITDKLDELFPDCSMMEFEDLGEEEGVIRVAEFEGIGETTGPSRNLIESLATTRLQLEMLNRTIESLELAG